MAEPLTTQRETEIRQTHPGDWYAGEWKTREVQGTSEEPGTWQVVSDGTALATLPDWAGPIALFIADAHDAVPELLAELARVRAEREKYTLVPHWEYELMEQQRARAEKAEARVAELEGEAACPSRITTSLGTSECALPVRHRGAHRNTDKNHYWDDEYADSPTP